MKYIDDLGKEVEKTIETVVDSDIEKIENDDIEKESPKIFGLDISNIVGLKRFWRDKKKED